MDDEKQIRALIERWAAAVHAGDLQTVLADHSPGIVMFDVPPPYEGVRGLDDYRDTWPPFFEWQARGASFEITSLEITAGADVAFAHALLRCGMPHELAGNPELRLRLTLGLVKEHGRWVVNHEHHSFPLTDEPDTASGTGTETDADADTESAEQIRTIHRQWFDRTAAKDLDGLMEHIADDVVSYEHDEPLQYVGVDAVRDMCRHGLEAASEVGWNVPDLTVLARGDVAVAWGLNRMTSPDSEAWSRGTRVFQRRHGAWQMTHQHVSYPRDPATGEASTDQRP